MPEARESLAACSIGAAIYIFGGYDEDLDKRDPVFKYDTVTNEWSTLAPMPIASAYHSASVLDGLVYIVGVDGKKVLRFDPASGAWSTLAPTSHVRTSSAPFVLGGCLCVAGGRVLGQASSVERYDVASNTWKSVADMLNERSHFGAVTIGSTGPAEEQDIFDVLIVKASRGHP
jgi:hypothetical protein